MTKVKYDKKRVLRDAYKFVLVGVPQEIALEESWRAEKIRVLKRMMATGIVEFNLKEAGKQVQHLIGTTAPHLIPKKNKTIIPKFEGAYVNLFDTEHKAWRRINKSIAEIEIL